jgi:glycosyltransferase involved in cell wall biosynthesis
VKVLIVSSLERGGPLEQALLLAAGLVERGVEVRVTCSPSTAVRFAATGVRTVPLAQRPGFDLRAAVKLWQRMRTADVVHGHDRRSGLWTRLAPGMSTVARIYTVHGLPDSYMPAPLGRRPVPLRDRIAYEGVDAALCRRADAVIIPSETMARTFRERLGFPADRIRVVPNGVTLPESPIERGSEIGTLSLLEPVKDVTTFLAAAARLAPARPDLRFVVFGEGTEREGLGRRARELGIADRVAFPGHVERSEAMKRLGTLVLPSIVENAPMALLEAMAAGVPVVASRTGGIPEITGEDTALLVAPGDAEGFARAIASVLDDPAATASRVAAARARIASSYTTGANVDATLRVYERALEARRGR